MIVSESAALIQCKKAYEYRKWYYDCYNYLPGLHDWAVLVVVGHRCCCRVCDGRVRSCLICMIPSIVHITKIIIVVHGVVKRLGCSLVLGFHGA